MEEEEEEEEAEEEEAEEERVRAEGEREEKSEHFADDTAGLLLQLAVAAVKEKAVPSFALRATS